MSTSDDAHATVRIAGVKWAERIAAGYSRVGARIEGAWTGVPSDALPFVDATADRYERWELAAVCNAAARVRWAELCANAGGMVMARVCVTKYLGPTNHRGGRVCATHLTTHRRVVVPWESTLDVLENHARAAARLLEGEPSFAAAVDGGGYIFGRMSCGGDRA